MAERKGKKQPSIINGRLVRVSPSQVATFLLCRAKWYQNKVLHLEKKPPGKGQEIGEACHNEIEHYALTGDDVRGRLARCGSHLLEPYVERFPFRGGNAVVEAPLAPRCPGCLGSGKANRDQDCSQCEGRGHGRWSLRTPGGVEIVGYMDLFLPHETAPEIIDHKFKGSIENYGSTPGKLRTDPQCVMYGAFAVLHACPKAECVGFAHHEHQYKGRQYANRVAVVLSRAEVLAEWAKIAALIDGPMSETVALALKDVPPTSTACEAFGGCDFKAVCPHGPTARWANLIADDNKEETKMGLLSGGTIKPQTTQAATPAATPAQLPAGTLQAKDGKQGTKYKIGDRVGTFMIANAEKAFFTDAGGAPFAVGLADPMTEDKPAPAAPAAPAATQAGQPAIASKMGARYLVNGAAAIYIGPSSKEPGHAVFANATTGDSIVVPFAALVSELIDTPQAAPAAPAAPVLPADAPKSDPAKATATAQEADEPEDGDEAETVSTEATPAATDEKPKRGRKPKAATVDAPGSAVLAGLVLCVGAAPVSGGTDLAGYVAEKAAKLAASAGASDVRLAGKDSILAFGGWKGALAQAAREDMPTGLCFLARSELADPVIEALIPLASVVIRPLA